MKVLHTIPYFNKASGGPVTCTYNLLTGLNKNGVSTSLLTFRPSVEETLAEDDFIHYLADDRKTPLWFSNNFADCIDNEVKAHDIVHANTIWTWPVHLTIQSAIRNNKPIVLSPHGMLYPQALKVSAWKKKMIGALFVNKDIMKATYIHATSEEEAKHIRNYGIDLPIAVIPNCIDMSAFPPVRETTNQIRRIGFIGRLNPIKNVDLLLEAWAKIKEITTQTELLLIGDGEPQYVNGLKDIVKTHRLDNVTFCGFLSGKELVDTIHTLDIQILPSKSENFGMVVAEALASGVPAITSKGTPWKILDEINAGWWIDANVETLASTLAEAIHIEEERRKQMGRNGRQYIEKTYSAENVAVKMAGLYHSILNQ